jgi:hypothetical protein
MTRRRPDPFDLLRDQLVAAAGPAPATAPGRRRRARLLVLVAAALAVSGTATAAVLGLGGDEPSAPLTGTVPRAPLTASSRYVISLAPDLRVGAAGWCATLAYEIGGERGAGRGCGPAAPGAAPQVTGGAMTMGRDQLIAYAVVDRRVATIRLHDGRRITPRPDPRLPFGWRGAVAFLPTVHGRVTFEDTGMTFLDAAGAPIGQEAQRVAGTDTAGTSRLPTQEIDPHRPPRARCAIRHDDLPHLTPLTQEIVRGPLARRVDVNGRAFRACGAAAFQLGRHRLRAAVLVDAAGPAHAPAPLPGATTAAGGPGTVTTSGGMAGRRLGNAWLVVAGGTSAERLRLLAAVRAQRPSG